MARVLIIAYGNPMRSDDGVAWRAAAALQGRFSSDEVEIVSIISRDPSPPPFDYVRRSGGLFRDMMIHDLDMARFLLGVFQAAREGRFAGVDPLLFPELVHSSVVLTNSRGVFDRAMAEYVLGLALALAKDLPRTLDLQRRREWLHRESERVDGRTALVVGAGSIGREIGRYLRAAGMRVLGVARRPREADTVFERVVGIDDLQAALPEADYVVLALPLTPETRGLFGAAALATTKRSARFINVGRGAVVDQPALVDALRSRRIAGAALDVFADEPLPAVHPFWDMPGVIVSPHMSGDFAGWPAAVSGLFVENFRRWLAGEPLLNVVDKARGYVPTV